MFENSDVLKTAILEGKGTSELAKIIRAQGMLSMAEDGLLKVLEGITTISEVQRVTLLDVNLLDDEIDSQA